MFGFRDQPVKKTCIRVVKVYDGVEMYNEVKVVPLDVVEDIKEFPDRYAYQMKLDDNLQGTVSPVLTLEELIPHEYVEKDDVYVVANVTYTHTTYIPKSKPSPVRTFLIGLALFSAFGMVALIYMGNKLSEQNKIDSQSYYYHKGSGTAYKAIISGRTYHFNEDGSMDLEEELFTNPYHRARLETQEGVHIYERGSK